MEQPSLLAKENDLKNQCVAYRSFQRPGKCEMIICVFYYNVPVYLQITFLPLRKAHYSLSVQIKWPIGSKLFLRPHFLSCVFLFFFFFGSAAIVDFVNGEQCIRALFTVPQITLFSHFFIKNGSHSTIYIFKNYFATVFSVSVFSFSKNKLNPNTP